MILSSPLGANCRQDARRVNSTIPAIGTWYALESKLVVRRDKDYSPAMKCMEPRSLVCFGVLSIWGRKEDAAARRVKAPITAIDTPIPIVTVLACHHALGISQKLQILFYFETSYYEIFLKHFQSLILREGTKGVRGCQENIQRLFQI